MLQKPMLQKPVKGEERTVEQLYQDYTIEKELAARLRYASRQERQVLYSSAYDEYYERVSQAPQLVQKSSAELTTKAISKQMSFLKRFLKREGTFLEVGPGDCALSIEAAKHVKQVLAIDVSASITEGFVVPDNFRKVLSDGTSVPVEPSSVSVAYSNQLMEHLHPDDALDQLQNIYNALASGGTYICITPNRVSGPHDISQYFDEVATGFHLKEYSVAELVKLFRQVGFSSCDSYIGGKGYYFKVPLGFQYWVESFIEALPSQIRIALLRGPLGALLGIRLVGKK
jgi:SAM-dependent methyltransferase